MLSSDKTHSINYKTCRIDSFSKTLSTFIPAHFLSPVFICSDFTVLFVCTPAVGPDFHLRCFLQWKITFEKFNSCLSRNTGTQVGVHQTLHRQIRFSLEPLLHHNYSVMVKHALTSLAYGRSPDLKHLSINTSAWDRSDWPAVMHVNVLKVVVFVVVFSFSWIQILGCRI